MDWNEFQALSAVDPPHHEAMDIIKGFTESKLGFSQGNMMMGS